MASAPPTLTLSKNRDRRGIAWQAWVRHGGVGLLVVVVVAALLNVFGQRPQTSTVSSADARLQVYAPSHVRGGLIYTARVRVDARQDLKRAALVFAPGWAEQYTFNGVAPQPLSEGSDDGRLLFTLGHIPQGHHYTLWVSLQVNPTNVGHHAQTIWLYDDNTQLAVIHREITIWP
ncbi:MAG: hypothetical protein JOY72_08240 [Actinobacteria bacterium]|nr:hypothetical protein [Actinomycetota bacterium]